MDQQPQEPTSELEPSTVEGQPPQESTSELEAPAVAVQPPQEPPARLSRRRRPALILSVLAVVLLVGVPLGGYLVIMHTQRSQAPTTRARLTPTATKTLAERWRLVDSPTTGQDSTSLSGVAASSPNDAWAWGTDSLASRSPWPVKPLLLHWDGQSWKAIAIPSVQDTLYTEIRGITSLAPDNAWLVGDAINGTITNVSGGFSGIVVTDMPCVIMHWDGHQWSQAPSQLSQYRFCELNDITALLATNIWAAGSIKVFGQSLLTPPMQKALVLHWDGQQWSAVPAPNPGATRWLSQITARAANDIWAIGSLQQHLFSSDQPFSPVQTLIEHWDGQQWSVVPSPSPGSDYTILSGIAALAPNDVWAVGEYSSTNVGPNGQKDSSEQPLTLHWDGQQWSVVSGPALTGNPQTSALNAVAALGPNDIWVVGSTAMVSGVDPSTGVQDSQMLLEHWDGQQWSIVAVQAPGQGSALYGLARVPGTDQMWAVGGWSQLSDPTTPATTLTLLMN